MTRRKEKFHVLTLGCPKNIVDSEVLIKQLLNCNYEYTYSPQKSDILIVNTCGFIQDAKKESISIISQAVEEKKEGKYKKIVVVGCLSERYGEQLKNEIPEIDLCIGVNKPERVLEALKGEFKHELLSERYLTTPGHYAYLKISEGCDRRCSFCSIPSIRGKHLSKPIELIIQEAEYLAQAGVIELNIVAQDTTYYGQDISGMKLLPSLLERLCSIEKIQWIRLLYTYPSDFPFDIFRIFKEMPKLCHYLDVPLQHISDRVLSSMRRGIDSNRTRELIEKIREEVPGIALRTTLIVGYPTEGEKEFEELLNFVENTEFERLGVFTFSREEGTEAYSLGDQVPEQIKEERRNLIMEMQMNISRQNNERKIGTKVKAIIDQNSGKVATGRTEWDAPEIDNEIVVNHTGDLNTATIYDVEVVGADDFNLFAVPAQK